MNAINSILLYLAGVNLTGFVIMGIDKWKAKKQAFRIPEATLFLIAIIGGSIGSLIGMYTFRHKTRHMTFVIGMPVILALQILILFLLYNSSLQFIFL
mgnify:CR=1 FL=1